VTIPTELAGRRVLATATVEPGSNTGHPKVRGVESENPQVRFLAVTTDDVSFEEEFLLLHCDQDWNVIWDSVEGGIESAIRQARWEYGDYLPFTIWGGTATQIELESQSRREYGDDLRSPGRDESS
jgi:hypothetical protein